MDKKEKARQMIAKLKSASLGDSDKLDAITKTLDDGGELEESDKQYLKKLYRQYKENKKGKKVNAVGFGMIVVIIVAIVGGVIVLLPEESETQNEIEIVEPSNESKLDTEEEIIEFISNYKGKDNSGPTLYETLEVLINITYPDENIFEHPSTTISIFALPDYSKEISDRYWEVEMKIKTYMETVNYKWIIDTDTNLVYPGDEESKVVLELLDLIDK